MITRGQYIEQILRDVYGEQPSDDSAITDNLVNVWVNEGIGIAIKATWKESLALGEVEYMNNAFYLTFNGLPIVTENKTEFTFKVTLPQIPYNIGRNEGIASLRFVDTKNNISYDAIALTTNQISYAFQMRQIPNKVLYWSESQFLYAKSTLSLFNFTATVRMIAASEDASNFDEVLNLPDDVLSVCTAYVTEKLKAERMMPKDAANDGIDKS